MRPLWLALGPALRAAGPRAPDVLLADGGDSYWRAHIRAYVRFYAQSLRSCR